MNFVPGDELYRLEEGLSEVCVAVKSTTVSLPLLHVQTLNRKTPEATRFVQDRQNWGECKWFVRKMGLTHSRET